MFKKFIQRPVLAISISLAIVFLGVLAIKTRPVSQFPDIAPPRVNIFIAYPGANANVLVESTLIPLERAINGVQGMIYLTSDATSAGEATVQIVFEPGTDPNAAVVNVKTRVDAIMNNLPPLVQREGIIITPIQPSMLMYVNLFSTDKNADEKFLYNYASVHIIPELQRIKGMGRAQILGSRTYAMRIWLKPDRMRAYNVSAEEVMKAMEEQSIIGRPGRLGQASGKTAQSLEFTLSYKGRFNKPEEYENIIVRATKDGELLKLRDVAEVELGSEFFDIYSNKDGYASASIVLKQNFGTNASEVIARTKEKLEELKKDLPPGMDYEINYDVSKFVDASIDKVMHTLVEAFILVALVVFVFLGDWRSTLIPIIAVPVSLVGAFVFMQMFGLTINLITLFALVLAIGIVVDDAIVVVEAVHAKMEETHLSPFHAVKLVLGEISGAVIAITLIMTAVFVPIAFMTGPVGVFYRQFSITMASSIVLSGIVALTLTPVLCAMILKNNHGKPKKRTPVNRFIQWFNQRFDKLTGRYTRLLELIANRRLVTFGLLAAFGVGIFGVNKTLPSGFIPNEDQGQIYAVVQTPPGSTLERTNEVSRQLQHIAEEIGDIQSVTSLAGYEILTEGRGSNAGTCLINLKDWEQRKHSVKEIIEELEEKTRDLGAVVEYFEPPAVPGYGSSDGFSLRLLDKNSTVDYQEFDQINAGFMKALKQRKELSGLFTFYAANYPQYEIEIDNEKAMQKGVSIGAAMENLNILIGSTYEQGFTRFNTFYKVYTQSGPGYRRLPSDVLQLFVKNNRDEMVPYSSFTTLKKTQGPNEITRFNLYTSSTIRGVPAAGYTTGDAIEAIREVAAQTLPNGYDIAWEGLSYDEANRGNEALYIFAVVLIFVYLVLASQYESFIIPLAVVCSLPAGVFGSFLLLKLMGLSNDIYAQIGLIMLIGLLGKNAVLIVEFAVQKHNQGATILTAAIEGAKARFRPILMTSFAFIAGLVPLVRATGAGAVGNKTIGASALGGMLLGTLFGVIIVPGLYYIFATWARGRKLIQDEDENPLTEDFVGNRPGTSLLKKMSKVGLLMKVARRKRRDGSLQKITGAVIILFSIWSCSTPQAITKAESRILPASYNSSTDTVNITRMNWREYFGDQYLNALIDTALKNNQELNILLQEIEISKNEIRARRGEYLPFVNLGLASGIEKPGRYTRAGALEEQLEVKPGRRFPEPLQDHYLGATASWEIDIWKKLRNARKSAISRYLASIEGRNFMVTNLIAEIADAYYELMALDNLQETIQQSIDIQTNALKVVRLQKESARLTQLAVNRFSAQLLHTQNLQYEIRQRITEAENRINFLTARFPQPIFRSSKMFDAIRTDTVMAGIPAQLLQQRPDIQQAEFNLAAARLDVDVARANFYPSLRISAGLGFQAFNPAFLINPESILFNLAGDLMAPLVNKNGIRAAYNTATAQQVQAVYNYERVILNAYVDVLNQLSKMNNYKESYETKSREVEILKQSIGIANNLFNSARADYGEVLLTQREAMESKMELIEIKMKQLNARVNIYRALGGGWQ